MQKIGGFDLYEPGDAEPLGAAKLMDASLEDFRDTTIMPKFCSSITHVDLNMSNASHGMRDWLQACREVKSFRFTSSDAILELENYHPRAIFENLAAQKASLERAWVLAMILMRNMIMSLLDR